MKVLEIPIIYEVPDEGEYSPDCQFPGPGSVGSGNKIDISEPDNKKVNINLFGYFLAILFHLEVLKLYNLKFWSKIFNSNFKHNKLLKMSFFLQN